MKIFKAAIGMIALTTMLGAPVLAQAVSSGPTRVSAASSEKSDLEGGASPLIAIAVFAVVIGGALIVSDDDSPSSP